MVAFTPVLLLLASTASAARYPISTDLYALIKYYTPYSAASYAPSCPKPPQNSSVVQYFNNIFTDTQATLFRDDTYKQYIIAFRGTSSLPDFITDFSQSLVSLNAQGSQCASCTAHQGALNSWNSISGFVIPALQSALQKTPGYTITATGHSLGGAIVAVASTSLATTFPPNVFTSTISFGQYRTGNPAFANYIDTLFPPSAVVGDTATVGGNGKFPADGRRRFLRVTHSDDNVPQSISRLAGYQHHSTEIYETEPFGASKTFRCEGQEPGDCSASPPSFSLATLFNAGHLCYTGIMMGNPLDAGASSCNDKSAIPQNCTTSPGGGVY